MKYCKKCGKGCDTNDENCQVYGEKPINCSSDNGNGDELGADELTAVMTNIGLL